MDHATAEFLTMLFVLPTFLGLSAWCFHQFLGFLSRRRAAKAQFEIQSKMLDKFSPTPELLEALVKGTSASAFATALDEQTQPQTRILRAAQAGAVVCCLAAAFLVLSFATAESEPFTILGVLGLGLGCGFLVAAAGAFLLSRKWGLLERDGNRPAGN